MTKQAQAIKVLRKDFELYCKHVLQIKTKRATIAPLILNRAQKRIADGWIAKLKAGKPIREMHLKARQIGDSTIIKAFDYWLCSMNPNRGSITICHDADSAANLFEMVKLFYKASPEEVRPLRKISNRRELYFANPDDEGALGLESRMITDTAENTDAGASFTIQGAHLSEYARYRNAKLLMASLDQAIPENPGTFIIKEFTAQGNNHAKDEWLDDENGYDKIFISWLCVDEYRLDINPKQYFTLSAIEESHYGDEMSEVDQIRTELMYWYSELQIGPALDHEIMCRLNWRRYMIDRKCGRDKNVFRQEYPTTAEQAFMVSGASVFDQFRLAGIKADLRTLPPDVRTCRFEVPSEDDLKNPQWYQDAFVRTAYGELRVYEPPLEGARYVIGADPAGGYDSQDFSAAIVLKCPDLVQVAVLNVRMEPDMFGEAIYALGCGYNMALLGCEVNSEGHATVLRLQRLRYKNPYWRETFNDKVGQKRTLAWGWNTNGATKPIMITDLRGAIRNSEIVLNDMDTIDQLMQYQRGADNKLGAPTGKHDDLVVALAIAVQMARQVHIDSIKRPDKFTRGTLAWERDQITKYNSRQLRPAFEVNVG